jgi:hypothetical protein
MKTNYHLQIIIKHKKHSTYFIFPLEFQKLEKLIFLIGFLPNTYEEELPLTSYNNIHEEFYIINFLLEIQ